MDAALAPAGMVFQHERRLLHDPVHPLAVDGRQFLYRQFAVHQRGNAAIAIGRPLVHEAANERQ